MRHMSIRNARDFFDMVTFCVILRRGFKNPMVFNPRAQQAGHIKAAPGGTRVVKGHLHEMAALTHFLLLTSNCLPVSRG